MIAEFSSIKKYEREDQHRCHHFREYCGGAQLIDKIENVMIPEFQVAGKTWMGQAINKVIDMLEDRNRVPERTYTPTIILLSDGLPSDCPGKWKFQL